MSRRFAWRDGDRVREVALDPADGGRWRATIDGVELIVGVTRVAGGRLRLESERGVMIAEITASGPRRYVRLGAMDFVLEAASARPRARSGGGGGLEAPMPGVVTRVMVTEGDTVTAGQALVAIEAMKMEHVLRAPRAGRVRRLAARVGEMVDGGVALVELEEDAPPQ